MIVEIPTELEAKLQRAARVRQISVEEFVVQAVRQALEQFESERLTALRSLRGSVSGGSPTVDEFLRERSEEGRKEAEL